MPRNREHDEKGRFKRTAVVWSFKKWSYGHLDSNGYFHVYKPDYPKAVMYGYAKRYHVVWWLKTGKTVPKGFVLHHKNEDKSDDRFSNLELLEHGEHTRRHCEKPLLQRVCHQCRKTFFVKKQWLYDPEHKGKFCSQKCYHRYPKSIATRRKTGRAMRRAFIEGRWSPKPMIAAHWGNKCQDA